MNPYGRLAMDHMRNWLPRTYSAWADPESHFAQLGELMATRINQEWFSLTPRLPGEEPKETLRRVIHHHRLAQAKVLTELAWPPPESPWNEDAETTTDRDGASIGGPPGWMADSLWDLMDEAAWADLLAELGLDPTTQELASASEVPGS